VAQFLVVKHRMTIKPNYFMAFAKTFASAFAAIAVISGVIPYFQGRGFHIDDVLGMGTLAGFFFGIFVAAFFTPREITWDDESIKIRALFPRSGDFTWGQLEAWSPYGRGTFLIKFEGRQAFQIAPAGFQSKDWRAFRSFLQKRFPGKKTLFWVGVRPIRFERKDDR
jgi:hypothetical protein